MTEHHLPVSCIHPQTETELIALKGDITHLPVDAIVNAANTSLLGGSGVDGAIHKAAGPQLLAECRQLKGCETGNAKLTRGYRLPARWVIHTVGPIWQDGFHGEPDLLALCYRRSMDLVAEHHIHSVAFPCISTGVYHFPAQPAARIAVDTVAQVLSERPSVFNHLQQVIFCCFLDSDLEHYQSVIHGYVAK